MIFTGLTSEKVEEFRDKIALLLEEVGLRVEDTGLRKLASEAGAKTDENTQVIYFPRKLQDELLSKVPEQYDVANIYGEVRKIGGPQQQIAAIVMDPFMLKYPEGDERPSLTHLKKNLALIQSMPDVTQVSLMDFPVTDYSDASSNLRALETFLGGHSKHYSVYVTSMQSMERWLELGDILNGGKPLKGSNLYTVAVASLSPMVVNKLNCELLRTACQYRFPVVPTVCPMAGSTGPYSQVGILLQSFAECIGIALLTQLLSPGNPFLFAVGPSVANLATVHDMYYTMDKHLWREASAAVARSYHMPFMLECGGTMPARYDIQAGAESMLSMLYAVGSGASLLSGLGSCYNANGLSPEMIYIEYTWKKAAQFLARGLRFEHMDGAVESIKEQGHGGQFLMDDQTLELMRSDEFFSDPLLDYMGEFRASPSMYQRAKEAVDRIYGAYTSPIEEETRAALHVYFEKLYR